MTNLMEITMRVEIYYSPVGVPGKKDTTQLSLSLTLLKCLMAPTFNGAFEEYYQFICEFKKKFEMDQMKTTGT